MKINRQKVKEIQASFSCGCVCLILSITLFFVQSTNAAVSNVTYSFEAGELPENFHVEAEDSENWKLNRGFASDGDYSFQVIAKSLSSPVELTWGDQFEVGTLSFDVSTECTEIAVLIDGYKHRIPLNSALSSVVIGSMERFGNTWLTVSINVPEGEHTISLYDGWHCYKPVAIDNVRYSELQLPEQPFSLFPGNMVVLDEVDLFVLNEFFEVSELIKVPTFRYEHSSTEPESITMLDDGRVAILNGGYPAKISLYDPFTKIWEHMDAEGFSSCCGKIASNGSLIYATNANPSGSGYGVFEFDLETGNYRHFRTESNFKDIVVSSDGVLSGLLYLDQNDSSEINFEELDLESLQIIKQLSLPQTLSRFAKDNNGNIFTGGWSSYGEENIFKYSSEGEPLKSHRNNWVYNTVDDVEYYDGRAYFSDSGGIITIFDDELGLLDTIDFGRSTYGRVNMAMIPSGLDSDQDGISDHWERFYGFDPALADANLDEDNDGLNNLEEYLTHTSPLEQDTDRDGVIDGQELHVFETSALLPDSDEDGINDGEEIYLYETNPLSNDSDKDGLSDRSELTLYQTNPNSSDSDSDGLPDKWETQFNLNPNVSDSELDVDLDGLTGGEEFLLDTNPVNADTDGDGLSDGQEVNVYFTDPLSKDSDKDRIYDGYEVSVELNPLDSNDAGLDQDSDGYSNRWEYFAESDPLEEGSIPSIKSWDITSKSGERYYPVNLDVRQFKERWRIQYGENSPVVRYYNPIAADGRFFGSSGHDIVALDSIDGGATNFHSIEGLPVRYETPFLYVLDSGLLRKFHIYKQEFVLDFVHSTYSYNEVIGFDNEMVFVGDTFDGLSAYNTQTGQLVWNEEDYSKHFSGFASAKGLAYYEQNGMLRVIESDTGQYEHEYLLEYCTEERQRIQLLDDRYLLHWGTGTENCMAVYDTKNKKVLWHESVSIQNTTVGGNGILYFIEEPPWRSDEKPALKAVELTTGDTIWRLEYPENLAARDMILTNNLLFVSNKEHVFAVDVVSGQEVWRLELGGTLYFSNHGQLYISTEDVLVAIELEGDLDGDGLMDWWERRHGLSLVVDDAVLDYDGDSISNIEEYKTGSNPRSEDTDGDGLLDDRELQLSTDILKQDTDDDGLLDGEEVLVHKSSPLNQDSDEDTIDDYSELFETFTDPNNSDSDLDELPDTWELEYGTQPQIADGGLDPDEDGLKNVEELLVGSLPFNADTDGDSLPDGWETQYGFDPLSYSNYGDQDGDLLSDYDEYLHKTAPNKRDTDDDGMDDKWEIDNRLDPLVPNDEEDPDGDSLSNIVEYNESSDPRSFNEVQARPAETAKSKSGGGSFDLFLLQLLFFSIAAKLNSGRGISSVTNS